MLKCPHVLDTDVTMIKTENWPILNRKGTDMEPDCVVRWMKDGDSQAVRDLHQSHYHTRQSADDLIWRTERHRDLPDFSEFPHPSACVAEAAGKIVAYEGFNFRYGLVGDTRVPIAESQSTLVDPAWQGRHLFTRFLSFAQGDLAKTGVQILTGIPSGRMTKTMRVSGFHELGSLCLFEFHAELINWLRPISPADPTETVPPPAHTVFRNDRSDAARKRRFQDRPGVSYDLVSTRHGNAMCRRRGRSRRFVTICDTQAHEPAAGLFDLLLSLTNALAGFPTRVISCWAVEGSALAQALCDIGYRRVPDGQFSIAAKSLPGFETLLVDQLIPDMMIGDFDVG